MPLPKMRAPTSSRTSRFWKPTPNNRAVQDQVAPSSRPTTSTTTYTRLTLHCLIPPEKSPLWHQKPTQRHTHPQILTSRTPPASRTGCASTHLKSSCKMARSPTDLPQQTTSSTPPQRSRAPRPPIKPPPAHRAQPQKPNSNAPQRLPVVTRMVEMPQGHAVVRLWAREQGRGSVTMIPGTDQRAGRGPRRRRGRAKERRAVQGREGR